MRLWHILRSRLRSIVFRDRRESDLSEELQLHLERETERLQASGLSREEARLQALRLFGGVEQIKEAAATRAGPAAGTRCARHAAGAPPPGARLAVHDGGGADPRPRHRRQHRDLQRRERGAVPQQAFADPDRLVNIYQNDRTGRPMSSPVFRLHGDRGIHRHLRGDDGRQHPEPRPLSPRRRRPRCGRRVRDGDLSRRPGTPAVARPLVRRNGGAAGRRSSPSSGIRRGPDCSARTHPSSDA